ncbi:PREDICTED: polycystic kidney disease protein 1-like 2 [Priapulus caudatus]|uniref:Polycystic kidney disease protein 1-like 2 n=1 Tax=Priapulus caudatus TaxID=37621 RepID=A0ABM1ETK0_PRICU|nr:PREDICTED: polycystic kidney disease protein 1-like 2 [Priapulus caudatus]
MGPFSFTLAQVYISFISTLVVLPANILQVQLFRKARPKRNEVAVGGITGQNKKFQWKAATAETSLWSNFDEHKTKFHGFIQSVRKTFDINNLYGEPVENSKYSVGNKGSKYKKKKKSKLYPHWVVYIGWASVILTVFTSGFFVILYSMEWGPEKSAQWLTAMVLSFIESVVFVQPFKVLALALFLSYILKKPDLSEEDDSEPIINATPGPDEELIGAKKPVASHRSRMNNDMAKFMPPETLDLEKMRDQRMKELKMEAVIKEIVIYVLFLGSLLILAHHNKTEECFLMTKSVRENFVHSEGDSAIGMYVMGSNPGGQGALVHQISQWDDVWPWLNKTLVPSLYAGNWYNGSGITEHMQRYVKNREALRVGLIRLRQQRIKKEKCKGTASKIVSKCWSGDDKGDYREGWVAMNETEADQYEADRKAAKKLAKKSKKYTWKDSPWIFQDAFRLAGLPFIGTLDVYLGGGYVLDLPATADEAHAYINEVLSQGWIDHNTRVLFIEFTVYNAQVNLFTTATLCVEFSPMGGVFNYEQVPYAFKLRVKTRIRYEGLNDKCKMADIESNKT